MIDKAFLGLGLNKIVCLRIQKYTLLYTKCKTQMQNESQEFRKILLHLILNGGLAELHDVAVRPQIGYIFSQKTYFKPKSRLLPWGTACFSFGMTGNGSG
jgi:hypothetical protein